MVKDSESHEIHNEQRVPKRNYLKPRLLAYGNLAEVTRATGTNSPYDNVTAMTKSRP